ncbi:MAG: CARDB domain-containing protein, partial [Bacteroidota bacterium]
MPVGVETDNGGNILVSHDGTFNVAISRYASNGAQLNFVPYGGFTTFDYFPSMARIPSTGFIIGLAPNGDVLSIDPNNPNPAFLFNCKQIGIDATNIYDLNVGSFGNLGGIIQPAFATYGDIAVYETSSNLYLFVSGVSVSHPFVARIQISKSSGNIVGAKVMASSLATTSPNNALPRGVAVNNNGLVLTTLSSPTIQAFDQAVGFDYDFDNNSPASDLPQVKIGGVDITSRGMCTGPNGDFYISTGPIGSTLGGLGGSGVLVRINANQTQATGVASLGGAFVNSADVAITPNGNTLYMTIKNTSGAVYRLNESSMTTISVGGGGSGGGGSPNLTPISDNISLNGSILTVNVTVENDGTASAGASTLEFFASTNTIISNADVSLGTVSVGSLAPSANSPEVFTVDLCNVSGLNSGSNYYIGYIIDNNNDVSESDESDNDSYFSPAISFNCSSSQANLSTLSDNLVVNGSNITATVTVGNTGGSVAASSTLEFFASTNTIISNADVSLGTVSVGSLAPSANSPEVFTVDLCNV